MDFILKNPFSNFVFYCYYQYVKFDFNYFLINHLKFSVSSFGRNVTHSNIKNSDAYAYARMAYSFIIIK